MHTARSARRVWSAPASAVEYTATASIPSSCSARITRTATSPRFATRTRENISGTLVGLRFCQQLFEVCAPAGARRLRARPPLLAAIPPRLASERPLDRVELFPRVDVADDQMPQPLERQDV